MSQVQSSQGIRRAITLILTGADVRKAMQMPACIAAMESAFRLLGAGSVPRPVVSSVRATDGGYHIKSALMPWEDREYFVSKTNANYPSNPLKHGLPTIQGTIVVHDALNGMPLAVMDSMEITAMRTAAATAVAARYLAREDARSLAVVGCGLQGLQHVRALTVVRPIDSIILYDVAQQAALELTRHITDEFGIMARVANSPADAASTADLVVTCTTSTEFILDAKDVRPGSFVAGVGVDAEHKRELSPGLLRECRVVVDLLDQCAAFGDLHHAIEAGVLRADDVYAELGMIVAGRTDGRTRPDQTFLYDSTGMALQDAVAAVLVLERARAGQPGIEVTFSA